MSRSLPSFRCGLGVLPSSLHDKNTLGVQMFSVALLGIYVNVSHSFPSGNSELSVFPLDSFISLETIFNSWSYGEFPKDFRKRSDIVLTLIVHDNESVQNQTSPQWCSCMPWDWISTAGGRTYQEGDCIHPWKCIPFLLFAVQERDLLIMLDITFSKR